MSELLIFKKNSKNIEIQINHPKNLLIEKGLTYSTFAKSMIRNFNSSSPKLTSYPLILFTSFLKKEFRLLDGPLSYRKRKDLWRKVSKLFKENHESFKILVSISRPSHQVKTIGLESLE